MGKGKKGGKAKLERKLEKARERAGVLEEENARLRDEVESLGRARRDLALRTKQLEALVAKLALDKAEREVPGFKRAPGYTVLPSRLVQGDLVEVKYKPEPAFKLRLEGVTWRGCVLADTFSGGDVVALGYADPKSGRTAKEYFRASQSDIRMIACADEMEALHGPGYAEGCRGDDFAGSGAAASEELAKRGLERYNAIRAEVR